MKRKDADGNIVNVSWNGHRSNCQKCVRVDIERSATFVLTCAEGGPLLAEELSIRALPQRNAKAAAELEYAIHAGVFHLPQSAMARRNRDKPKETKEE